MHSSHPGKWESGSRQEISLHCISMSKSMEWNGQVKKGRPGHGRAQVCLERRIIIKKNPPGELCICTNHLRYGQASPENHMKAHGRSRREKDWHVLFEREQTPRWREVKGKR
jgi:hypothetical protein